MPLHILKYRRLLIFIILLNVAQVAFAQVTGLFDSRPVKVGARAAGLGDAYFADAYDVTSMYWNPAALAHLQTSAVVASHFQEKEINAMNENITAPLGLGKGEAIGIGLTYNHAGYIGKKPSSGYQAMQIGYDIAYAREVTEALSLGAGLGVRYAHSSTSHLWGVFSTLGVYYYPSPEISYGLSYSGIGSGILYATDGSKTDFSSQNLPRSLKAGVELRFPPIKDRTVFTLSVANEKVFGEDGIRYMVGAEFLLFDILLVRSGYERAPDLDAAHYGMGIRTARFQIDYGISPSGFTDRAYQFSLAYSLW